MTCSLSPLVQSTFGLRNFLPQFLVNSGPLLVEILGLSGNGRIQSSDESLDQPAVHLQSLDNVTKVRVCFLECSDLRPVKTIRVTYNHLLGFLRAGSRRAEWRRS